MKYINDHWLEQFYKGWSDESLAAEKESVIRMDGPNHERVMLEREIERRKEAEEVA